MNKSIPEKIFRLNRLTDIFILIMGGLALVIIQLPFPFQFDRNVIWFTAFFTIGLLLIWHLLTPWRLPGKIASLVDSLVGVGAVSIVVHVTGGIQSYFIFLYFLPALTLASTTNILFTLVFLATTYSFLLYQSLSQISQIGLVPALSLTAFYFWVIGIVIAYGRFLAKELAITYKREEIAKIEQAEEVSKLKDEFVFIVSHELRSPITAIRGYLELIMTDPKIVLPAELKQILSKSFSTANKLANLISLLLEISRLESGKIKFYLQKIKVSEVVTQVMKAVSPEAATKKISVTIEVDLNIEVYLDSERLYEILTILIENALRFTPEYGKIGIRSTLGPPGTVLITISDTGIGITKDLKEHLFDKFYSIKIGSSKEVKGIGLGLYACKKLLKAMGGDIWVESEIGSGSKFTLSLPKAS